MARRVNYGFEKFQKEAKRKKKQAEKLERKRLKKEGAPNPDGSVPVADAVPAEEPAATTTENTTNS